MSELDDLRKEAESLSARSARFAIASIVIFAVVSLAFGRALRSVDRALVKPIVDQVSAVAFEETSQEAAEARGKLHEAIEKFGNSFDADVPLFGTSLKLNMLYWGWILPFFLLASLAHLTVMSAKSTALRVLAQKSIRDGSPATKLDHLVFGSARKPSAYTAYPGSPARVIYLGCAVLLLLNLTVAVTQAFGIEALIIFHDFIRQSLIAAFYVLCYTRGVRWRIINEARAVAGEPPLVKKRRLARLRDAIHARIGKWWRAVSFGGSALTLASLFLLTAAPTSCNGTSRKGYELFLGHPDAVWPLNGWLTGAPILRFEQLGRWMYISATVFAALAILLVSLSAIPRIARWTAHEWLWDAMRAIAVTNFLFVVCEFGFVWTFAGFGLAARIPPLWQLAYWMVPSAMYVWMTVIKKAKWMERWRSSTRRTLFLFYAPAMVVAPITVALDNWGITALFAGTACLAIAFTRVPVEAMCRVEAKSPPAFAVPAATPATS